ncbi:MULTISPECIES: nucleotide sugar dehydrogenase [Prochlorococcus]|uniref:UDP-glucose 6-dehydrogenase n=1 Tax=Prochlorococcus marinus str. MIT 9116 TaxID=167544 RepID=A0A0A1ZWX6_PROMR|nr:nucleotide sugar dehydrogenase [Prochlorococcus marinus]KGF91959.1 UDP-glucose dehydrogenase [Prochlorococcus marinus str. MIT 9107]KGF93046.1 UDP-glucose dehydrogenase [Prochlorococcus marinus str. MIT 9116]KGF93996.1 UDP-glucose dehydrogenase [Prochlorococcus marinus str. MIT 9123]
MGKFVPPKDIKRICCIGAGYVGGPSMAVIADNCPNIKVTVVDINKERIQSWNSENFEDLPVFEPGLKELIKKNRGKNLFFSNNVKKEIESSDMIFLCVNTPTKIKGIGSGKASDLKWLEICANEISNHAKNNTIIVEKSTVPVKTAEILEEILSESNSGNNFSVLSNPEFLAEGTAINDLLNPDRILIGGKDKNSIEILSKIYMNWVSPEKIIKTNIWSSELSKLSANAFLAQRISSINSISAICEETGADINEVSKSIGADSRIGSRFLQSGPGFGGSCFKKDILNLIYLCDFFKLPQISNYWESVLKINDWQKRRISKIIVEKLFGTVSEKKIAILGFAFKADTNDTRESPSISICQDLLEEGAKLFIHDPKVKSEQINFILNESLLNCDTKFDGTWEYSQDIDNVIKDAHAIIILTEWEEYSKIKWIDKEGLLKKPLWIFDTRSIIDIEEINKTKIKLWRLGSKTINLNSSQKN